VEQNLLDLFHHTTTDWFERTLGSPTPVQVEAWPHIAQGANTLVSAPTGTGKTLTAFLIFIDRLMEQARNDVLRDELYLIYVSPLKSLAGDIRENLNRPLNGIIRESNQGKTNQDEYIKPNTVSDYETYRSNKSRPIVRAAIRTGDTTQAERRNMIKLPPHILITTPESLYLMLTSESGKGILKTARAIIIDELHALIDTKRGAHLMLSLARLDKLCGEPLQRIGLSATIRPLTVAAAYLSSDEVKIAAPAMDKDIKFIVEESLSDDVVKANDPFWQNLAKTVYNHCMGKRNVIAFTETRLYAEKLAYYVNQLTDGTFARTHHGSMSKEHRLEVENELREGNIGLLCATSSMELGIDVGEVEQVLQIGCPKTISSTLQRLGRAGHNPGRTSIMYMFPKAGADSIFCGMTAKVARAGGIELCNPPNLCFDVLSQHLVSMATGNGYTVDEAMDVLGRAYPFREVTKQDVKDILAMLAGDYEHERDIPVRPRVLYDRIHELVRGDAYSRMLAISTSGTIPDKGMYAVKTENNVKLGELDEEFVYESRVGDKFMLGTFTWQITNIQKDHVSVVPVNSDTARVPFWRGEQRGRDLLTGLAFGRMLRDVNDAYGKGTLHEALCELGLTDAAAETAGRFVRRQIDKTGILPSDKTILIEHFVDGTGKSQMMVHSIFGRRINTPLGILVQEAAKKKLDVNIGLVDEDNGFVIYPYDKSKLPTGLLREVNVKTVEPTIMALLPSTASFSMNFRYNCFRALMMGVKKSGRQPLWMQRHRSAEMLDFLKEHENHPLIRETKRECLEEYWDLDGVVYVLDGIRKGDIQVIELVVEHPSPLSIPFQWQVEGSMVYDRAPVTAGVLQASLEALKYTENEAKKRDLYKSRIKKNVTGNERFDTAVEQVIRRKAHIDSMDKLHTLLMTEGDITAAEMEDGFYNERETSALIAWLRELADAGRAMYVEPGLWIAAEHKDEYLEGVRYERGEHGITNGSKEALSSIIRRTLRYKDANTVEMLSERYHLPEDVVNDVLASLCKDGHAVENDGTYYHQAVYERAVNMTVRNRRVQFHTLPPERYAALMIRHNITNNSEDALEKTITRLVGQYFPVAIWEGTILTGRMDGYRPSLMDSLLANGRFFWHIDVGKGLCFYRYDDIDWDSSDYINDVLIGLEGMERIVYEALAKRGSSFAQGLTPLLDGASPYESLVSLVGKGLVHADSFSPVRHLLVKEKTEAASAKKRIGARMSAIQNCRFEVTRPIRELPTEEGIGRLFDSEIILCRETIRDMDYGMAMKILGIWELIGKVRRGYFIKGMSGAQFIRDEEFANVWQMLEGYSGDGGRDGIVWIPAIDPAQIWGKAIGHMPDRAFMNVVGTVVALDKGSPVAVMERQGNVLEVFDDSVIDGILGRLIIYFKKKRIYASLNRLVIKQYPKGMDKAFKDAGFMKEIKDYVLYR